MRRTGGTWATVGLVVLGVVAAVLAFAAMRSTQATPTPAPSGSALATPNEEEKPGKDNKSDTEPPTTDSLPKAIEPPLLMVDTEVAYRGSTGTCLGGASLERTTNGGRLGVRWSAGRGDP